LEWYSEGLAGDGVTAQTVREARAMAGGLVSEDKAVRMAAWFARHMTALDAPAANPSHDDYPSPGVVAHALWGGGTRRQSERAQRWAEEQVASEQRTAAPRHERKAVVIAPSGVSDRTVTGVFSVFGNMDSYADVIHNGAMEKTLRERGTRILHLWQHDMDAPPIAMIESIREEPRQALPEEFLLRAPTATGGAEAVDLDNQLIDQASERVPRPRAAPQSKRCFLGLVDQGGAIGGAVGGLGAQGGGGAVSGARQRRAGLRQIRRRRERRCRSRRPARAGRQHPGTAQHQQAAH
jgi:hypothetical protein